MLRNLKKSEKGFTIIEVLIVLAIAGLIMLIVFLAVPALQRNQRNNARNSDASRISGAISECLANRNGQTSACDAGMVTDLAGTLARLEVIEEDGTPDVESETASYSFQAQCDENGEFSESGGNTRDFTVTYEIETSGGPISRCIGSSAN